ncbi:MAG: N-acetylmuramoyl-L-alanine amidase [Rhodospirillaceae bacterium]|nr:N-acetylmuramoyl-L-alanine amidase [Rhodospirillaceae bacterium]
MAVRDKDDRQHLRTAVIGRRTAIGGSLALIGGTGLPALAAAGSAATGPAAGVRVHDHGPFTRLVVELPELSQVSAFLLEAPSRLVIDLGGLVWPEGAPEAPAASALIKAVRAGEFQPGHARIVADLAGPVSPARAFMLAPTGATPWRLVFDLAPSAPGDAAVAFGPNNPIAIAGGPAGSATIAAAPSAQPAPIKLRDPSAGKQKLVIAIDPGHGGIDPGAVGLSGIYEKAITLSAAQQLKAKLEATGRYRAVLTRARDTSLGLRQRIEIARHAPADAFISLHADSVRDRGVRGLSVYTLSEKASDSEAATLAEAENKADLIIGMDLSHETQEVRNILIDLAQRESMNLASRMAAEIIKELGREVKLLRNTHRFAGFAVLKAPDIPSVLVEMGYLSNREDEAALRKEAYRGKLMGAVVRALDRYFAQVQVAKRT